MAYRIDAGAAQYVENIMAFGDGPNGVYLSGGLKPDIEVKIDPDLQMALGDILTDPQLQKAVEVLKSKQ